MTHTSNSDHQPITGLSDNLVDLYGEEGFRELLGEYFGDHPIRSITKALVLNLMHDLPLTPAQLVDFGVDSHRHYRALQAVLDAGITIDPPEDPADGDRVEYQIPQLASELDQAYGNGPTLTALVKKYAPDYGDVVFLTSWDVIAGRSGQER